MLHNKDNEEGDGEEDNLPWVVQTLPCRLPSRSHPLPRGSVRWGGEGGILCLVIVCFSIAFALCSSCCVPLLWIHSAYSCANRYISLKQIAPSGTDKDIFTLFFFQILKRHLREQKICLFSCTTKVCE